MNTFSLSEGFISQYRGKHPEWGPLGYVTYKRTYARPIYEENRTEEYWETVQRVVEGTYSIQKWHCDTYKLPWNGNKAQRSAQEMYKLMWNFKFLPPGRGLWMMGTDFIWSKGGAALNNCAFVSTKEINLDFAEPFCFLMDMSMLGVGVGGDTKGAGLAKIKEPRQGDFTFTVEDSREGWVELIRTYLNAYVGKGSVPKDVDYSKVRPYGALIKGFGGTSSGPKPLQDLVKDIQTVLNPLINQTITGSGIVDLFNMIGRCVVAGNVRRTAEIMFGDPEDIEFLELKNPEVNGPRMNPDTGWGWTSNNSVFAELGMDYSEVAYRTGIAGEPGYFWLENARAYGRMSDPPNWKDRLAEGANPCVEQTLESYELCCLVETFPARHNSYSEYERTLKFAYLYAKTVTLLATHNPRTNAVMLRNRRIGTSQSGIAQSFGKHGVREHFRWCDEGYKYLGDLDTVYSDWLCVPRSKKTTSVKPSGSISKLPGATPGIHFPEAEYYYVTMRFDSGSDLLKAHQKAGYRVEKGEGHTTSIVYFPVHEENFYKSVVDQTMWEQLEIAAQMQAYWADNQVSVTIKFKPEEKDQIPLALQLYEKRLKAVSFMPLKTVEEYRAMGYKHPPIQPITKQEYEDAMKSLKKVKFKKSTETQGFNKVFCDGDTCELSGPDTA